MQGHGPAVRIAKREIACDSAAFAELSVAILAAGKGLRFKARGYSMHPLVRDGDLLLVSPVDAGLVRRGDLVFFLNHLGAVVVHRVIRRRGNGDSVSFETRGDGLTRTDGLVPDAEIFGRVCSIERNGNSIDVMAPGPRLLGLAIAVFAPLGAHRIRSLPWLKALIRKAPLVSRYL